MALIKLGARNVKESGTFLIAGGDNSGTIKISDLEFQIRVLISQDPPTGKYETPDNKSGIFTFVGAIGITGNTWVYNHVAKIGGHPVGAIIRIQTVASPVGTDPIFCVTYTFADKSEAMIAVGAA